MPDIALVSYINTRPFVDGLEAAFAGREEVRLHLMPPSSCARALFDGQAQLALVPAGALLSGPSLALLPTWCIGANGAVDSVFLFSQRPVEELEQVWLDRHSRSSNALAQILMIHHWKKEVRWLEPARKHFEQIQDTTGGIVIGDEALRMRGQFPYQYDLAAAWKEMTGLPFAFAVWAYLPGSLSASEIDQVEEALKQGVSRREATAEKWAASFGMEAGAAKHYLTACIDYRFDEGKHRALDLYLKLMKELPQAVRQPR